MQQDLNNLEQLVEREMHLLRGLPDVQPAPQCVARVTAAVLDESARLARRRRWLRLIPYATAAAAAILLAAITVVPARPARVSVADPDRALARWQTALDETRDRLRNVAEGWTPAEGQVGEDAELDGWQRGLDTAFESLQSG